MKNFRFYNLITGWTVFAIATVVYLLTMESTSSFWDCGEFIATAYKLEVGHPPGAPFFMVLGRFFTLFAGGNVMAVAVTINVLSALASSFTILFLYWTISHLVRKFYERADKYSLYQLITILGSGVVGALAYTFSDSFWFSAAEAEVYSISSLFTAIVFWAMLKWENVADERYANRWIVLIAFLMGISIGVHLLNLLAIPALVFVYYFRKYKPTALGIIASLAISVVILAVMLFMIIPGVPWLASQFELAFVNGLNMPFFSGVAIYVVVLFGALIAGIYIYQNKTSLLLNTMRLSLFVIVLGYSSYAVIVIRSAANTPLDESNPETVFALQSYLNREQYGDRPLMYGAYFNARPTAIDKGKPSYYKGEEGYVEVDKDRKYTYDKKMEGLFPRLWSTQEKHTGEYIYWGKLKESDLYNVRLDANGQVVRGRMGETSFDRSSPKDKPTFGENMRFFFRYQVGHMYMRYFMWNFAGRQNDIQSHGEPNKGNWISGIKFIDEARLGPQDNLPGSIKDNWAHNKYYMLPLILGLIGLIFHYRRKKDDAWVVTLLYIMTGFAILVYLNQSPVQPRERDYAYAASFYAFAIWIGLGVAGIIEAIAKKSKSVVVPAAVVLATLILVPGIMMTENWDDHDRSGRTTARDFARNYLNSVEKGAIIFTNGDNDTFPLWYVQEVEGYRTDVRVVNLSYLTADWYIEQMTYQFYDSDALPLSMNKDQYQQGKRDYAYLVETAGVLITQKYRANESKYEEEAFRLFNAAKVLVDNSALPSTYANDYKAFCAVGDQMDPYKLLSYMHTFSNAEIAEKISIDSDGVSRIVADLQRFVKTIDADYLPLEDGLAFLATDDPRFKDGQYFIPANKFILKADSATMAEGVITDAIKDYVVDQVRFTVAENVVYKNSIAQLDMFATNNWERPIYYSNTVSNDNFLGLEGAFVQEGLAYRIAPINAPGSSVLGMVDTEKMYQKLVTEFLWGGIDDPDIYLDENNLRMTIKYRYSYATLAKAFSDEGNNEKAIEVLDYCMAHMPHERVPFNFSIVPILQSYFAAGAIDKGMAILDKMEEISDNELQYYESIIRVKPKKAEKLHNDYLQTIRDISTMSSICLGYGETETARRLEEKVNTYAMAYEQIYR